MASTWAQGLSYNFRKKRHTLCPLCQRAAATSTLPSGIISAHSTALTGSFSRRQVGWQDEAAGRGWPALKTSIPSLQGSKDRCWGGSSFPPRVHSTQLISQCRPCGRLACTGRMPWCSDVEGERGPCREVRQLALSVSLSLWSARQEATHIPGTVCDRRVGTCEGKGKVGFVLTSKIVYAS